MQRLNPTEHDCWQNLKKISAQGHIKTHLHHGDLNLHIHHQKCHAKILKLLCKLADQQGLDHARQDWLKNGCQDSQSPYYTNLRSFTNTNHDYQDILYGRHLTEKTASIIRKTQWRGFLDTPITDVVNIGMGGSDLGPKLCCEALASFKTTDIRVHFISDADAHAFKACLNTLNPSTTLFLVSSKSFATEETLHNAKKALQWMNHPAALEKNFIAITAYPKRAEALGFHHILPICEWVIGRFSCFSAINLITAILIGKEAFEAFLMGACDMDKHFLNTPMTENLPMMLALLGIWNINFLNIQSHLLLIHDARLSQFLNYIQQLDMESNGKSVNWHGETIDYPTSPILWGGLGNPAHHSYYQFLAQGSHQVAIDFISVACPENSFMQTLCNHRKAVLHHGVQSENQVKYAIRPQVAINHIHISKLTPYHLGALIALYEHKVFTQAWLWNINPFDQPGVEMAKKQIQAHRELQT